MILIRLVQYIFFIYIIMIAVRIVGSWFPAVHRYSWFHFLARCTDPYLNIFRRLIPPIGGVLDLSPLLAYFVLQLLEYLIIKMLLWAF